MAAEEVAGLVRDHACELRLVTHPEQKAGEDDCEAAWKHHRIELGNSRKIDAEVLGRRAADGADQVLEVTGEVWVIDKQVRARDLLFGALHKLPDADLVALGGLVARAD